MATKSEYKQVMRQHDLAQAELDLSYAIEALRQKHKLSENETLQLLQSQFAVYIKMLASRRR